jgi:hypothetical protein
MADDQVRGLPDHRALTDNPGAGLAVVAAAQFIVVLNASAANVALPTIKGDLGYSQRNLSWQHNTCTLSARCQSNS